MRDGFFKAAAMTPDILVANPLFNGEKIREGMEKAWKEGANLLLFPELCLTGYTCSDLFIHGLLLESVKAEIEKIKECSKDKEMLTIVGAPIEFVGKLYNCALFIYQGTILGIVPKQYIPNYAEFYEARHFTRGSKKVENVRFLGEDVPFGANLLFACEEMPNLIIGCEICEDLWTPLPPSSNHALKGATVIVNPSASVETTTKEVYRKNLVSMQSARLVSAYIYADAGEGESTTDVVFSGHNLICENGAILAESKRFENAMIFGEIDLERLAADRRKMSTFLPETREEYEIVSFSMKPHEISLERYFPRTPFIPSNLEEREKRCEEILTIQAMGLKKRLAHTRAQSAVIGISGGLDSTLAVLVTARAFDMLGIPREKMICVTMPCFGTTDRTYQNALTLTKELGATLKEVKIMKAVEQHFEDIGHDKDNHNVTYENAQARERTQVLMDMSNQYNGLVIGTGDMSELALGWATYNGDHMSMYGVNASVPKTLVRHLVRYYADTTDQKGLRESLLDVLDTPVSPELLPPVDGVISQKTEDLVGPYELHDFFLYYMLRFGYSPKKIFRIARIAFNGEYEDKIIYKWLRTFCWRFFAQQFKRSCLPDGPKVGSVGVSPRGDLRMPSDASSVVWMTQMDELAMELGIEK